MNRVIVFQPCTSEQARALFERRGFPWCENSCYAYSAEVCGQDYYCLFTVADTRAEILDLDFGAGDVMAEGLLRAALNFAAGKSAYAVTCGKCEFSEFLIRLGFSREGRGFYGEIPDILTGSCCSHCTPPER